MCEVPVRLGYIAGPFSKIEIKRMKKDTSHKNKTKNTEDIFFSGREKFKSVSHSAFEQDLLYTFRQLIVKIRNKMQEKMFQQFTLK